MHDGKPLESIQLEVTFDVLLRLLRDRSIVASEFRSLNCHSAMASMKAVKTSLITQKYDSQVVPIDSSSSLARSEHR